jgi:WhiB family redox-sensing transcriptional regulator
MLIDTPTWWSRARCLSADPVLFFPEIGGSTREGKAVCNGVQGVRGPCPVRDECLAFAFENRQHFGIWGGLSENERQELKRRERQALREQAS